MPEKILVAGGCGFIGSHVVRQGLERGYGEVTLDAVAYAASRQTLADLGDHPHHRFVHGSIGDRPLVDGLLAEHRPRAIINLAAATHVDRSIEGPRTFFETNVRDVFELLESARHCYRDLDADGRQRFCFLQVSTDEVFGSVPSGSAAEDAGHRPSSPYSASKAAADDFVHAWGVTYGLPVLISHSTNNYGPYQFPEKLFPHMLPRAMNGMPLPLYGDGLHRRDWLHVNDHVDGLFTVLERGVPGTRYNLGSGADITNLELVQALCRALDRKLPGPAGQPFASLISHVDDRPGHDRRYSLDITASRRDLDFAPSIPLEAGLDDADLATRIDQTPHGQYRDYLVELAEGGVGPGGG